MGINRWFLGTTWAALAIVGGLLVLLYNLYPDRSLEAWEKRCAAGLWGIRASCCCNGLCWGIVVACFHGRGA